ncbi:MAG: channel protein TolC [Gammaproteobacteria bacterium]|nr:MAG: channel protein TolC [Gammaproteobacteria bacterium]
MIKNSQIALGLTLLFCSHSLLADDLLDIYQSSLKNDPAWAARESNYLADREQEVQTKSLLRPTVGIVYSKSRSQRTGPDIGAGLSEALRDEVANCFTDLSGAATGTVSEDCSGNLVGFIADPSNEAFALTETGSSKQKTTADNFSLRFTQPLFNLENWYLNRGAKSLASRGDAEFAFAEQQFIVDVAETYFNVLKAAEELHFAKTEQSAIGQQLAQTKEGVEVGLIQITDVHEAQGAYDLSQTGVIVAEGLLLSAQEQLATLTNRDQFNLATLAEDFPIAAPQPSGPDAWVKMAQKNNKSLLAMRHAVRASLHKITERSAAYAPKVDFFATFDNLKTDNGDDSPVGTSGNLGSDVNSQTLGLQINIPLYSGGLTSSRVREAKHRHAASRAQQEVQSRRTAALAKNLYRKVNNGVRKIEVIRITIDSNQNALEATQAGYATGTRNVFDVLQAQRTLFSAKRDYANARYDYLIDSLKLKQVGGILEAVDLRLLNEWLDPA